MIQAVDGVQPHRSVFQEQQQVLSMAVVFIHGNMNIVKNVRRTTTVDHVMTSQVHASGVFKKDSVCHLDTLAVLLLNIAHARITQDVLNAMIEDVIGVTTWNFVWRKQTSVCLAKSAIINVCAKEIPLAALV